MKREEESHGRGAGYREVGRYLGIGVEFTAAILICLGIGWWIDKQWDTSPAFMLVGAFVGMAAGFYNLYRTVVGLQEKEHKEKDSEPNT